MTKEIYYTVTVTQNGITHVDGVGENWTHGQALAHVVRCEYIEKGIECKLTAVNDDTLQSTEPIVRRPKSSRTGSNN